MTGGLQQPQFLQVQLSQRQPPRALQAQAVFGSFFMVVLLCLPLWRIGL
jgi:hypothetical protein